MTKALLLIALSLGGWAFPSSARAQPSLRLSFLPDRPLYTSFGRDSVVRIYIQMLGGPVPFRYVAFGLTFSDHALGFGGDLGPELWYDCDFPPRNWCLVAMGCQSSEDYPVLASSSVYIEGSAYWQDLFICPTGPIHFPAFADGSPEYYDCQWEPHRIPFVGGVSTPDGDHCLVINPSPIETESTSWGAIKGLWR